MNSSLRLIEPSNENRATPDRSKAARLAVIVVTYNSASVLPGLLDSLPSGLEGIDPYEIIVVDNDSRDESVEVARTHRVGAKVIQTGRNAGYAAGINIAMDLVGPNTDILVLNPDIRLKSGSIQDMYRAFRDPKVGIVVPQILHEDGTVSKSIRREPSMLSAWSDALLGGRFAARVGLGEIVDDPALYAAGGSIEWATGAILLISAAARRTVGDWDESFFLYSEEIDYLQRARAANLSIAYTPEAKVTHIGGDYLRSNFLTALLTRNRIKYYRRHHGSLATLVFRLGIIVGEAMRSPRNSVSRAALKAAIGL